MQTNAEIATAPPVKANRDLYREVTERIIAHIENGTPPWCQSWSTYGLAKNYATGHVYTGINFLLMNSTGYRVPYFMTYNQVKERNGHIQKGAKGEMVVYFTIVYKDASDQVLSEADAWSKMKSGQDVKVFKFIKYYTVFNMEYIDGIDFKIEDSDNLLKGPIATCEDILWNMARYPTLNLGAKHPSYNPLLDCINMPTIDRFRNSESYYLALFHELVHATGHEFRLAREEVMNVKTFGSMPYSREELVAEIGASFLCAVARIDYDFVVEDSASYLAGWLNILREDSRFIFKAAAEAQKAVDFILNRRTTKSE